MRTMKSGFAALILLISISTVSEAQPTGSKVAGLFIGTRVLTDVHPTRANVQCFGTVGESAPVAYTIAVTGKKVQATDGSGIVENGRLKKRNKNAFQAKVTVPNGMYIDKYKMRGSGFNTAAPKIIEKLGRYFEALPKEGCIYTFVSENLIRQ